MTTYRDKTSNVYGSKSKTLYPYEYFQDENSFNKIIGTL